jgi:hypothetical protein
MADASRIDLVHPANASVLRFLGVSDLAATRTTLPSECDWLVLGTHPDLVEHLWTLLGPGPDVYGCALDARSHPLLVAPGSRVVFGLAAGTSTLALRLPEPELAVARAVPGFGRAYRYPSATVQAAEIGDDWALVRPFVEGNAAWGRRALELAESLGG